MRPTTKFALMDPGLLKAGLFRPYPRGGRSDPDAPTADGGLLVDGGGLFLSSPVALRADDLRILLALLALAAIQNPSRAGDTDENRRDAVDGPVAIGNSWEVEDPTVVVTRSRLCSEAGLQVGGGAVRRVRAALDRIGAVTYSDRSATGPIHRLPPGDRRERRLLWVSDEEQPGNLVVTLNARFTPANSTSPYIRINLDESRHLGEMARLLHLRLCLIVREGQTRKVGTDHLCDLIYGGAPETGRQRSRRREEIRKGMAELEEALPSWTVTEHRRATFEIARPSRETRRALELSQAVP